MRPKQDLSRCPSTTLQHYSTTTLQHYSTTTLQHIHTVKYEAQFFDTSLYQKHNFQNERSLREGLYSEDKAN